MKDAKIADEQATAGEVDLSILTEDLGFQVHITRRAIWHRYRSERQPDVPREPSGFYATLILIGANPGISQSEIADALFLDMPNLAIILGKLADYELVVRERDPADRRRLRLRLTPAGEDKFQKAVEMSRTTTRRITSDLTDDEIRQLTALLGKLQRSVKAGGRMN
ncbi:MAG: MarR family winged helix-turn-helix transcriptional regulator [Croceibacterium sp.]